MAALAMGDSSVAWVERAQRFAVASWLFLGAGIGLGAVWAYVVLGWGGYWGWDPVENASLLPWLVCTALVHTFTVYRQRGAFKRWALMSACLAFTFVVVATFITRSGIVQSVHAFAGDPVSLALFGGLIAVSLMVPTALMAWRWKSFGPDVEGGDDMENLFSKDAAYYFNNVIMIASALLLAWGKSDPRTFARRARVPAAFALALSAALAYVWATQLVPVYDDMMAKGSANSQALLEAGPGWYYNGLALVGLLVASLLFFNAAFVLVRNMRASRKRGAAIDGTLAHSAMAVVLVGLIGSSMYVYEESGYIAPDGGATFQAREYSLVHVGDSVEDCTGQDGTVLYQADFDVFKDGAFVGQVHPSVELDATTQQQKLNAAVMGFPEEDLFVVYRGVNANGDFSLDVRVNPLKTLVWAGLGILMLGTLAALVMPRRTRRAE